MSMHGEVSILCDKCRWAIMLLGPHMSSYMWKGSELEELLFMCGFVVKDDVPNVPVYRYVLVVTAPICSQEVKDIKHNQQLEVSLRKGEVDALYK